MAKKLVENKSITKTNGDSSKIYCEESYAQELYDLLAGTIVPVKDLSLGDILRVSDMKLMKNNEVEITCDNYETLYFSISKEKRYLELLGISEEDFSLWVGTPDCTEYFKTRKTYVSVENVLIRKGSLYSAHLRTIVKDFKEQILKPTSAYVAKVLSKNQGGFLVEVLGIKAFLPGSLAAANKIVDFDDYIGKEVFVMIEDYLVPSDIFVVSYKKYLDYILPSKLGELERNQYMSGSVTGTSKFGVFVEFGEIFTGLLHVTEMSADTLDKFNRGGFKSGIVIEAWLKDIKDNKLILTENDPAIRQNKMEEYRDQNESMFREATIISIKPHGALMEIEKGVLGLLPIKEMKKSGKRLVVGETIDIFIKKVDTATSKIYLTLLDERITAEI